MPNERKCHTCGSGLVRERGDFQFDASGLKVVLKNIELLKCGDCAEVTPRIPRLNDLMRAIAVAVVSKPFELSGDDVRFVRKFLNLSGDKFAKLLDVDRATISRWENSEQSIGAQSDRLIRLVAVGLGDGLKEKLEAVIQQFEGIKKQKKKVRLEVNSETLAYEYKEAA